MQVRPQTQRSDEGGAELCVGCSPSFSHVGHEDPFPPLGHRGGCLLPWEMKMGMEVGGLGGDVS